MNYLLSFVAPYLSLCFENWNDPFEKSKSETCRLSLRLCVRVHVKRKAFSNEKKRLYYVRKTVRYNSNRVCVCVCVCVSTYVCTRAWVCYSSTSLSGKVRESFLMPGNTVKTTNNSPKPSVCYFKCSSLLHCRLQTCLNCFLYFALLLS